MRRRDKIRRQLHDDQIQQAKEKRIDWIRTKRIQSLCVSCDCKRTDSSSSRGDEGERIRTKRGRKNVANSSSERRLFGCDGSDLQNTK